MVHEIHSFASDESELAQLEVTHASSGCIAGVIFTQGKKLSIA